MLDTHVFRIGLAGYLGAGKSTVSCFFADAGAIVIDADAEAKKMMQHNNEVQAQLLSEFGPAIRNGDRMDFALLGEHAFASRESLLRLNAIVHPPLLLILEKMLNTATGTVVLDAALLPLWKSLNSFNRLYWISASPEIREKRVLQRNSMPIETIRNRMALQEATVPAPSGHPWTIIENTGTIDTLHRCLSTSIHEGI
jgi:dephospho-CoA kinase